MGPFKTSSLFLAVAAIFVSGCHSLQIERNQGSVTTNLGEKIELTCTIDTTPGTCTFTGPKGQVYAIVPGASYENDRIVPNTLTENDCAVKINSAENKDNGQWKCSIGAMNVDNQWATGDALINVTVAVAPERVLLRVDGQESVQDVIQLQMPDSGEEAEISVDCVAEQARPRPEFAWFIGSTEITGTTEDKVENASDDQKSDYVQTLKYFASTKHNGQQLRCEVQHEAYTEAQKANKDNVVEKELVLLFKPQPLEKPLVFYNLKPNSVNEIRVKFEANPEPIEAEWTVNDVTVPMGAESLKGAFTSGFFEKGDVEGEHSIQLTIAELTPDMAGKDNTLKVTNNQGTTEYKFKLELGGEPAPAADQMSTGPIIAVIILIIIVLVFVGVAVIARSKGILCFAAAKDSEQLNEEKSGTAFDQVEKGEPLNPKASANDAAGAANAAAPADGANPDKAADQPAPTATAEQEEKKSNGAHTPV